MSRHRVDVVGRGVTFVDIDDGLTPLDPDPLYVEPVDRILPAAEYVAGFDAGWHDALDSRPRLLEAKAFGCGVVVGIIVAIVLIAAATAAPRSGQTTVPGDVSPALSAGQSGAPLTGLLPLDVTLTSSGGGRVVDLDDRAFARLAPLSVGVLRVRVLLAGPRPTAPATDVGP